MAVFLSFFPWYFVNSYLVNYGIGGLGDVGFQCFRSINVEGNLNISCFLSKLALYHCQKQSLQNGNGNKKDPNFFPEVVVRDLKIKVTGSF